MACLKLTPPAARPFSGPSKSSSHRHASNLLTSNHFTSNWLRSVNFHPAPMLTCIPGTAAGNSRNRGRSVLFGPGYAPRYTA